MRTVDAAGHPFLHEESFEVGRVIAQIDRWNFDDNQGVIFGVDSQIDVASAAAVDLSDNAISVENHSRGQKRRERQFRCQAETLTGFAGWKFIDADDLNGEVVRAAVLISFLD